MKTVIAFPPNNHTVFSPSAVNLGLRLASQAGVHHLKILSFTTNIQTVNIEKPT